jgi:hypothetical protein
MQVYIPEQDSVENKDPVYPEEFASCRIRKTQPLSAHRAEQNCGHNTPKIRTDYCRVLWVICASLCIVAMACVYYKQFKTVSNSTDTLSNNFNEHQGDVLVVSLHLRVQGATKDEIPKTAEILIPIDSLRHKDWLAGIPVESSHAKSI